MSRVKDLFDKNIMLSLYRRRMCHLCEDKGRSEYTAFDPMPSKYIPFLDYSSALKIVVRLYDCLMRSPYFLPA